MLVLREPAVIMEQYFDQADALKRIRGNQKLLNKMLELFLQSQDPDALEQALLQDDSAKAAQIAHAIKGVSGNLSLTLLCVVSSDLMQELREGKCRPELLQRYQEVLVATRDHIQEYLSQLE